MLLFIIIKESPLSCSIYVVKSGVQDGVKDGVNDGVPHDEASFVVLQLMTLDDLRTVEF